MITLLKSKIHLATVTAVCQEYEGSLSIDAGLMETVHILPYEQIHVFNCNNGARFITYAIPAPPGSGTIQINGAAAHLAKPEDKVIIVAYHQVDPRQGRPPSIKKIICDNNNHVKEYREVDPL